MTETPRTSNVGVRTCTDWFRVSAKVDKIPPPARGLATEILGEFVLRASRPAGQVRPYAVQAAGRSRKGREPGCNTSSPPS